MPGPVPGRRRLGGLDKPNYTYSSKPKPSPPPLPAPSKPANAPKCCPTPSISYEEGSTICYSCGRVLDENEIVAEVTFGETAGGAAVVEGGFIGENQRHANSMGGTMRGLGGMPSREQSEMNGRSEIRKLCAALHIRQAVEDQAFSWYKLAINHSFVVGRRIRNVAAVAIYMAARRQPDNTLMLMDLSEKVQVNVWALGDTYKAFLKKLMESDPAQLNGSKAVQEIEPLMLKYCRRLEFDEASHKVADDACKLLKRMKRDWMVQGRQPAGLCGACIILAARMNNFRRTVREVVYVVKVADSTINQRLYEYKRTPSSALTVDQFREFGQRLKVTTQPPAIWRRAEREERKEERKRRATEDITSQDTEDLIDPQLAGSQTEAGPSNEGDTTLRANKKRKIANGKAKTVSFQLDGSGGASQENSQDEDSAIPDVDALEDAEAGLDSVANANAIDAIDGADEEAIVIPKKRGRPPKKREPILVSQEDMEIERDIENEITQTVRDWEGVFKLFEKNENHEVFVKTSNTAKKLAQIHMPNGNVNDAEELEDDEFEDDPDVATCVLAPHEVRIKERIWITANEDWLREQQEKILKQALEEAQGKPKKPKQRRKHHQMGDGSILEGQPATSAADAAHRMLKKRAKHFSSHINYDKLKELFPGAKSTDGTPATTPPEGSAQGASPLAAQPTATALVQNPEPEEEEEEYEEEENEAYDEEFDDPRQYMSDEEGFNENDDYEF